MGRMSDHAASGTFCVAHPEHNERWYLVVVTLTVRAACAVSSRLGFRSVLRP
jgi:hypothetical protein